MDTHRCGFVAVIGRPNVGKSTFLNTILQQKIAAVSPRPQTTRRKQLGILTDAATQIIFTDTPGIHQPVTKLGESMNDAALETIRDCDVLLWLVDASADPQPEDQLVAERIRKSRRGNATILALNKVDQTTPEQMEKNQQKYSDLLPGALPMRISALDGTGLQALKEVIVQRLPEAHFLYEEDVITDLYEREIAADLVREAMLKLLRDEIPHLAAVRVEEYKERNEQLVYVQATILVEKESHKGIVIGKNAEMLKRIGQAARQEIEAMCGKNVFLELKVKLSKNWRDHPRMLQSLGYILTKGK